MAVGACGDDQDEAQRQTGPFAVGTRTTTFVDASRPTKAFKDQPAKDERTIVTNIWYPAGGKPSDRAAADAAPADGRFPLVVFIHGQHGEPQQYGYSMHKWAEAGYVVAAPRQPLTVLGGPGADFIDDSKDVLADIPFVITSMGEDLSDLVDLDHVAVIGHSSGAIAALGVALNTCCHDERIDAVALESVIKFPVGGEYFSGLPATPILFLHGTADGTFPIDAAHKVFEEAEPPKFFLSIEKGDHSGTFRYGDPARLATRAVVAFLDAYIKDREDSLDELRSIARESPLAELEAVPE